MAESVQYFDWSDRSLERYEGGEATDKYGEFDFCFDDQTDDLELHLRRETKRKRDFTILLPESVARALYEKLKHHFEE